MKMAAPSYPNPKSIEPTTWGGAMARKAVPTTGCRYLDWESSGESKTVPTPAIFFL